jgi:hypothetical protein
MIRKAKVDHKYNGSLMCEENEIASNEFQQSSNDNNSLLQLANMVKDIWKVWFELSSIESSASSNIEEEKEILMRIDKFVIKNIKIHENILHNSKRINNRDMYEGEYLNYNTNYDKYNKLAENINILLYEINDIIYKENILISQLSQNQITEKSNHQKPLSCYMKLLYQIIFIIIIAIIVFSIFYFIIYIDNTYVHHHASVLHQV